MDDQIARDAYNVTNNLSARRAKKDFEEMMYKTWVDSENAEEREKLHSIAVGGEMFWRIMDQYAKRGKIEIEGLDQTFEESLRAID